MRRARGFTLLEAVVALTILGFALLGAFGWINGDLIALGRVRELALEEAVVGQALAELEQVDLSQQPEGRLAWQGFTIDWRARAFEEPRQGRSVIGARGAWDLALYEVELEIANGDRLLGRPTVRMVQYARARAGDASP